MPQLKQCPPACTADQEIAPQHDSEVTTPGGLNCRCPMCSDEPLHTYSPEYMYECMLRAYGHFTPGQSTAFMKKLRERSDWSVRLAKLEMDLARLKAEGRYETSYWRHRK